MSKIVNESELGNKPVLAMYDLRRIQNYIYKTSKVREARGASAIVNDIIADALENAVIEEGITSELDWYDDNGVRQIKSEQDYKDVQVIFIGGGNATVLYKSRELCVRINRKMSKYVLENTYSLQLAIAMTEKTDSYSEDYKALQSQMFQTKAKMAGTKPLGTLPVMKMELKTGYPIEITENINGKEKELSRETYLKKERANKIARDNSESVERRFDAYITKKGTDSTLAVVHIDGNNMGLRIRGLIENEKDYVTAINKMRHISYNINHSYQSVFNDMADWFNSHSRMKGKENKNFVLKILVAGDDITYVCNANIAIATVEYYCNKIAVCTMNKNVDDSLAAEESIPKYGFSVCAGIAYYTSHFPFNIAYNVAEECCNSAKKIAKAQTDGDRVANFLDFQICKNIQAQDIKGIRIKEYKTATGEQLINRPYYVSIKNQESYNIFEEMVSKENKLTTLIDNINYFKKADNIPRSFAKDLRNTYADGQQSVGVFSDFLKSRNHKMPDGTFVMYEERESEIIAKWYDALELMDYYEEATIDE